MFIERLGYAEIFWPSNLYLVLVVSTIGFVIGLIADKLKVVDENVQLPLWMAAFIGGVIVMLFPGSANNELLKNIFLLPALFLALLVFALGAMYIGAHVKNIKSYWSRLLFTISILVFTFATLSGNRDYYDLSMRVGEDRALFEAYDSNGQPYRLPFAIKLINQFDEDSKIAVIRIFDTVTDYVDVDISMVDDHKTKGWIISLKGDNSTVLKSGGLLDVSLLFDRWVELKYISLVLLLIAFVITLKY